LAWSPPSPGASFPDGLRWAGEGNRYDLQGKAWVVSSADGLSAPDDAPTNLDSWVASLGEAGDDDSEARLVGIPVEADLESGTLAPARFAARSDDRPIGADPSRVGPSEVLS